MQVNASSNNHVSANFKPAGNSFDGAAAAGISPVGIAGGTQLEQVAMLAKGWKDAIAAADQGMRGLQVK